MDPFSVLGVDSDADEADIKRAYRQRAKETHPDRGGSEAEFKRVKDAYEKIQSGEIDEATDAFIENLDKGKPTPEPRTTVTYLNYEVMIDRGWSLTDDDLFAKAADATLDHVDYGRFTVDPNQTLLEAAEQCGYAWPFACRGGACANCAVAITKGEISQLVDHILSDELADEGIRLSCNGTPLSEELHVVYNLKQRADLDDLKLPADRFKKAQADD